MPSHDLLFYFQEDMQLEKHWHVNGAHYGLTSEAWCVTLHTRNLTRAARVRACSAVLGNVDGH
eukprot:COSAG05_NODE_177_length_14916_cov_8.104002_15_plen_63_part_00